MSYELFRLIRILNLRQAHLEDQARVRVPSSAPIKVVVKKVEDLDAPGSWVDPHKTRETGFWIVKGGIKQWRWGDRNGNWSDNDESPACVAWKKAHNVPATT